MKTRTPRNLLVPLAVALFLATASAAQERPAGKQTSEEQLLAIMHSISSHTLQGYVEEMCSEKYQGRLTGTPGYDAAANWAAALLARWNIMPAGEGGTYLQRFPNPYTLVLPGAGISLHLAAGDATVEKHYLFEKEFFPGSTSDSGTVTAEVVYAGYGVTAPDLDYDDYGGIDVTGKIVLVEPEVPIAPDKDPELFARWRPYSFHDYKVRNAKKHGAAGMIYNYHIANPNAVFVKDLVLIYVGRTVVDDIFAGTGRKHADLLQSIRTVRKPTSFATGKTVTMTCVTEHHPDGMGANVVGILPGSDPVLKDEAIIIGAHLDHLGLNHELMPGAHDNASGVAVVLAAAEALSKSPAPLKRPVVFILFGAEEQGVKGSEFYVANPVAPNDRVKGFINLESVGRGERFSAGGARNYPELFEPFERLNQKYIHRQMNPGFTANLARPRQDAAHFMWAGVPTLSFGTGGAPPLPYATYHTTRDTPEILTPEIMEDLARLVFLATVELANR
jgi:hypothetical protein